MGGDQPDEAAEASAAISGSQPCPRCGVMVAPGYVRCPRCHADMPGARPKVGSLQQPGGTSVTEDESEARPWMWPALAIAGVLAIGGVVWMVVTPGAATRRSTTESAPAVTEPAPRAEGTAPDEAPDEQPAAEPGAVPAAAQPDRGGALQVLDDALRAGRLWATVEEDGDVVVIRSEFCSDPGLDDAIAEARAALRDVGLRSLRCEEPHGSTVFQRAL